MTWLRDMILEHNDAIRREALMCKCGNQEMTICAQILAHAADTGDEAEGLPTQSTEERNTNDHHHHRATGADRR